MFFLMFLFIIFFMTKNFNIFYSFNLFDKINIEMNFNFSLMNNIFSLLVVTISIFIFLYSKLYFNFMMKMSYKINLMIFIISMIILINSSSFILFLIGWDGLGISSFFLILYYMNYNSIYSSLITFFFNRLGDSLMIVFCCLMINLSMKNILFNINYISFMIIMLGAVTKSSQIPFGVWLPMAMSAPTPISSLVHSSTLVTTGIYMIMKLEYVFFLKEIQTFIMFFSLITFFLSSLFVLSILDFKKSIAFSTMSQMGLILFSLSTGNLTISFYQLIFHALFKSLLFMNLGFFMMMNFSIQDFRLMKMFFYNKIFNIPFFISCFNLMGLVFSSGFLSKDYIIEYFLNSYYKMFINLILFISCIFTASYSLKFMLIFFIEKYKVMKFMYNMKLSVYLVSFFFLSTMILILPSFFMQLILVDHYIIFGSNKIMFYLIIVISVFILKIFLNLNKILFLFSNMLMILDLINLMMLKFYNLMMKSFSKIIYLEEFVQLNLILKNFSIMKFNFNIISLNLIFIFLIFSNFYIPSQ